MKNKKKLIILSIVAILLIVVLSSVSYAYFTTTGSTGSEETISSGTMALSFSDGPQINATNLAPGDYIEKTFSVTNTGTLATTYDVYLSEVVNTFVQKSDLVYEITSNDGGYNTPNQVVVPNQEAKIVDTQSISVGATHHYTLKITYKLTNQIQNDNMGRGFTAKININEYNLNNTEKLLKLLDTSGNLVDKQMISSGVSDYYYNLANTSLTGTTNIYCNNGGIPRIENNQLIVSGLNIDTECKMSADIQDTINSRLSTSKTGIVMTNNQSNVTTTMEIKKNKQVIFDLNGKEVSNHNNSVKCFINNGDVTFNDSIGTGAVNCDGNFVSNGGDITINNGSYSSLYTLIPNNGIVTINNGNFYHNTGNNTAIISSNSNNTIVTINNGYFEGTFANGLINNGATENGIITINDGQFVNVGQIITTQSGVVTINNGYFISDEGYVSNTTNGITNIFGGNFESNGNSVFNVSSTGTLNINGNQATFDDNGNYLSGLYIHSSFLAALIVNSGNMDITNGTFIQTNSAYGSPVIANRGLMNIYGGYFESNGEANLTSTYTDAAILNVYNGNYYVRNNVNIYVKKGTANIYNGNFVTGGTRFAAAPETGQIYITNATANGKIESLGDGSKVYVCGGTFDYNDVNLVSNYQNSELKYKSNVVWVGKNSPTVGGNYSSNITLDDSIVCPS